MWKANFKAVDLNGLSAELRVDVTFTSDTDPTVLSTSYYLSPDEYRAGKVSEFTDQALANLEAKTAVLASDKAVVEEQKAEVPRFEAIPVVETPIQ